MEQPTGSKLGKEYIKAVYCHLAYLTYMQVISQTGIEFPGGNINNLRYADDTTLMAKKGRVTKEPLDEGKREEWKSWLETQHYKSKIRASGPNSLQHIEGEKVEMMTDFIVLGSQITADSDYSREIKRHLVIGRKAMINHIKKQRHHFSNKGS